MAAMDANYGLVLLAEAKFCGLEEPVDDIVAAAHPVIDEFGIAGLAKDEERRGVTGLHGRWHLDEDLAAIIKRPERRPFGTVSFYAVVEMEVGDIE